MRSKAVIVVAPKKNEIELVQALGYKVILFKAEVGLDEAFMVDLPIEVDLNNEDLVVERLNEVSDRYDISGVFTLNEYRIPLAAKMSNHLGISSGLSVLAANQCRNKKLTRQVLNSKNVSSVQYELVCCEEEAKSKLSSFQLPVIVKPSNESGSKNVRFCRTDQEVVEAVRDILQQSRNFVGQPLDREVIVEEFLDGTEYSVEACTIKGETRIIAITEKFVTPFPYATEVGHTVPANLCKDNIQEISQLVKEGLLALEIDNGVTHTEVKLTSKGPKIIEVNGRPGGDDIPVLVRAVTGYDLCELSLHIALGGSFENAPWHEPVAPSASIRFLVADSSGTVFFKEDVNHDQLYRMEIYVEQGEEVAKTTSNYNRLGYFIVFGTEEKSSNQIADEVMEQINLHVLSSLQST